MDHVYESPHKVGNARKCVSGGRHVRHSLCKQQTDLFSTYYGQCAACVMCHCAFVGSVLNLIANPVLKRRIVNIEQSFKTSGHRGRLSPEFGASAFDPHWNVKMAHE